jgi:hypothetical protein
MREGKGSLSYISKKTGVAESATPKPLPLLLPILVLRTFVWSALIPPNLARLSRLRNAF